MKRNTIFLSFFLLCCGCMVFVPQKDSSIFYTLCDHSAERGDLEPALGNNAKVIGLCVGDIPAYADCPYIVTKHEKNKVALSENTRWAEPFQAMCARLIKDKLSSFLAGHKVIFVSNADLNAIVYDYRVSVSIDDLIYNDDEKCALIRADWSIFDCRAGNQVCIQQHTGSVDIGEFNFDRVVDGMKRALGGLTAEIAEKIIALAPDHAQ